MQTGIGDLNNNNNNNKKVVIIKAVCAEQKRIVSVVDDAPISVMGECDALCRIQICGLSSASWIPPVAGTVSYLHLKWRY